MRPDLSCEAKNLFSPLRLCDWVHWAAAVDVFKVRGRSSNFLIRFPPYPEVIVFTYVVWETANWNVIIVNRRLLTLDVRHVRSTTRICHQVSLSLEAAIFVAFAPRSLAFWSIKPSACWFLHVRRICSTSISCDLSENFFLNKRRIRI